MADRSRFHSLPDELLIEIFRRCSTYQLSAQLPLVSRRFCELLRRPTQIWQRVQLSVHAGNQCRNLTLLPWLRDRLACTEELCISEWEDQGDPVPAVTQSALPHVAALAAAVARKLSFLSLETAFPFHSLGTLQMCGTLRTLHADGLVGPYDGQLLNALFESHRRLEDVLLQFSDTTQEAVGDTVGFPAALCGCTALRALEIHGPGRLVMGNLPPEFGNLCNLISLKLINCQVSSLPDSIGSLTALERCVLITSTLREAPELTLPSNMSLLTAMTRLGLSNVASFPIAWPPQLVHLVIDQSTPVRGDLQRLSTLTGLRALRLCNGSSSLADAVPGLAGCQALAALCLDSNRLDAAPIPPSAASSLVSLVLHSNRLSELPDEVMHLLGQGRCQVLDLSFNPCTRTGLSDGEAAHIGRSRALMSLGLRVCYDEDVAPGALRTIVEVQREFVKSHAGTLLNMPVEDWEDVVCCADGETVLDHDVFPVGP